MATSREYLDDLNTRLVAKTSASDMIVNQNLLDNWHFGKPVNQRGKTEYSITGTAYTIDRFVAGNLKVALSDGGITLTRIDASKVSPFYQMIPNIYGDAYMTLSILTDKGLEVISGKANASIIEDRAHYQIRKHYYTANGYMYIGLRLYTSSLKVIAMKLEIGGTQTLAHQDQAGTWVLNEIPDYGEQLGRCQRYYYRVNASTEYTTFMTGTAQSTDYLTGVPIPVAMRAAPSLSTSGNLVWRPANVDIGNAWVQWTETAITVITRRDGSFKDGWAYQLASASKDAWFALSADL